MKKDKKRISDYFGMVAVKLGGQIHLRSLRDGFASIMPFMILAGFVIFINIYSLLKLSVPNSLSQSNVSVNEPCLIPVFDIFSGLTKHIGTFLSKSDTLL